MIQTIALDQHGKLHENIPLIQLQDPHIQWFWIDFSEPTEVEIEELSKTLQFHPLAIEDCIHKLQRPKLDYYDSYTFFVTHTVNPTTYQKEEINFFHGSKYFVSFHHQAAKEIYEVWNKLLAAKQLAKWNPNTILYHCLDKIVDGYFPIVYELEDRLETIINSYDSTTMENHLEELFTIRKHLLNMRHTVNPMRDLLYRMLNSHHLSEIKDRRAYFADIHDHLLKLSDVIESNREITTDIRDTFISINSHQTNKVMKVLTVITTIFMPLTFIAGLYGMNFKYMPETNYRYGYFIILFIMMFTGLAMYLYFKRKGWFK